MKHSAFEGEFVTYDGYIKNNMSKINYIEKESKCVYVISARDSDGGWFIFKVFGNKQRAIDYCKSRYPREYIIQEFKVE